MARLALAEEQLMFAMGLAGQLPCIMGQLAEAHNAAQGRRERMEALETALEEKELALGQMSRELEAMQDAQAVMDVEALHRQLGRLEGDQRAAILGEQRASWNTLQEIERCCHVAVVHQGMERLELMESLERQSIAEEQARDLDLGSVVQQLHLLVDVREEALRAMAAVQAQPADLVAEDEGLEVRMEQLAGEESRQRTAIMDGEQLSLSQLQQQLSDALMAHAVLRTCDQAFFCSLSKHML